jgi:cytosine-specific methyltransferase
VPQRRRRVFVVGHTGNRGDLAAKVLFDGAGVQGDIAPREKSRKDTACKTKGSTGSTVYLTHPQDSRYTEAKDIADTVTARYGTGGGNVPLVLNACTNSSFGVCRDGLGTLTSRGVAQRAGIRRLTPVECERLQGFPDNWTQIEWRGKPKEQCPDSHRYKAIGNSMAVPVMRWIGNRINEVQNAK